VIQSTERGVGRPLSDLNFTDFKSTSKSFVEVEGYGQGRATLLSSGEAEVLTLALATPGFLPMLGIRPAIGRSIEEADSRKNAPNVAVISDALWRRKFQGDPAVLTRPIQDAEPSVNRACSMWTAPSLSNSTISSTVHASLSPHASSASITRRRSCGLFARASVRCAR